MCVRCCVQFDRNYSYAVVRVCFKVNKLSLYELKCLLRNSNTWKLSNVTNQITRHLSVANSKRISEKTIAAVVQVVFIWNKRLNDTLAYTCVYLCLLATWNGACAPFKCFGWLTNPYSTNKCTVLLLCISLLISCHHQLPSAHWWWNLSRNM